MTISKSKPDPPLASAGSRAVASPSETAILGEADASLGGKQASPEDYDLCLQELSEEMELIREELERTRTVLTVDRGERSSTMDIAAVISALRALQHSEAANIIKLTGETHQIASKMSHAIRVRAAERNHALELQRLVKDLMLLQADYKRLKDKVHQYHAGNDEGSLDELTTLYHGIRQRLDSRMIAAWRARQDTTGTGGDGEDIERALAREQQAIGDDLLKSLQTHIINNEGGSLEEAMGRVFTTLRSLHRIGYLDVYDDGLGGICQAIRTLVHRSLISLVDVQVRIDFRWASKGAKVVDFGRVLGSWCIGQCAGMPDRTTDAIKGSILEESISGLCTVMRRFLDDKRVCTLMASVNAVDTRELDLITAELTMLAQSALSLLPRDHQPRPDAASSLLASMPRFDPLLELLDRLIQYYHGLETAYMRQSVKMAIDMNSIAEGISTCVEDVFFIFKKSINRATALGEQTAILAVLEQAKSIILEHFVPFIQRRSRQLYPDVRTGDCVMICLNDVMMAKVYLLSLTDEIKGLIFTPPASTTGSGENASSALLFAIESLRAVGEARPVGRSKILATINDLELTGIAHLDKVARNLGDVIYSTQVKSKIAPFLFQLFKDLFISGEGRDPQGAAISTTTATASQFRTHATPTTTALPSLIDHMETVVMPVIEGHLLGDAKTHLVSMIAKEFSLQLERKLLSTSWTGREIQVLDSDYRKVAGYLADISELQSREILLRVSQMLMLLGAESRDEAHLLLSQASAVLSEADIRQLLVLRSDFDK